MQSRILGIHGHLPERTESNDDLAAANPDWDLERISGLTGIVSRHIAEEDETAADLGFQAAKSLLERQLTSIDEVDYLIVSNQTPDHLLPSDACLLQDRLGLGTHIGAVDIRLGCNGFVCGLQMAKALVESAAARNVLLITAETYSKLIHPRDRTSKGLFGDGAAAALIGASNGVGSIGSFVTGTDGSGGKCLSVPSGGFRLPRSEATAKEVADDHGNVRSQDHLQMDGQSMFMLALDNVPKAIAKLLQSAELSVGDVDWWVFHQANRFMLENLAKCSQIDESKMAFHLKTLGNTVSSSIPLAISHYVESGKIQSGQRLVLVGFGVGFSWSACELTWG